MSEQEQVARTPWPRTRATLARDLAALGLRPGMAVLVHASLQSLGWVAGGPVAVIQALLELLTGEGTLIMPAHSGEYSDPARWRNPAVPPEWVPVIQAEMPAWDPQRTPTRSMGAIGETFRTWPGVQRSVHPQVSFAAFGRHATHVTANHSLAYGLGEQSPLARLYHLDGYVLLLGVGYDSNTSFHLAEHRCPFSVETLTGAPMLVNGRRRWQTFPERQLVENDYPSLDGDVFLSIGAEFDQSGQVTSGPVGSATARFFPQRAAVDFALRWLTGRRQERMAP